jgi:hypothetical protein
MVVSLLSHEFERSGIGMAAYFVNNSTYQNHSSESHNPIDIQTAIISGLFNGSVDISKYYTFDCWGDY